MKTIEEKAKAYDKALEKAESMIDDLRKGEDILAVSDLESMFPELKESEDEKIRKAISQCVEDMRGQFEKLYSVHHKDAIAWLEKQGEHANFLSKIQVGDKVTRNEGGVLVNISQLERVAKPRKVKPVDKVEPKFKVKYAGSEYNVLEVKEIAGITYYGIEDEPNHIDYVLPDNCEIVKGHGYGVKEEGSPYPTKSAIFTEQKPTIFIPKFRVGDKLVSTKNPRLTYEVLEVGHINELGNPEYKVEIFTDGKAEKPRNIHYMECDKVDEWAKLIEQKPIEWSEDDEKNLQEIIDEIHANRNVELNYDINTYDRFLYFLNSLKQRIRG